MTELRQIKREKAVSILLCVKPQHLPACSSQDEPASCGLQELLNDVHCIIEAMIGRGSDVALRKPEMYGIPPVLLGDPDRVRGILLNLSTNAAKFTKKGHITMKVSGPLNRRGQC